MNLTMKASSRRGLNLFFICCILLVLCHNCHSSPTNYYFGRRSDKKYCGTDLTETLQILCDGRYNLMIYKKSDLEYKLPGRRPLDDPNIKLKYEGVVEGDGNKRQRRSIIDECCQNPCAYKTLEQYCQTDSDPKPTKTT